MSFWDGLQDDVREYVIQFGHRHGWDKTALLDVVQTAIRINDGTYEKAVECLSNRCETLQGEVDTAAELRKLAVQMDRAEIAGFIMNAACDAEDRKELRIGSALRVLAVQVMEQKADLEADPATVCDPCRNGFQVYREGDQFYHTINGSRWRCYAGSYYRRREAEKGRS